METGFQKFDRVAAPRIENARKAIELLQNLRRKPYESTDARRTEIVRAIGFDLMNLARAWRVETAMDDIAGPVVMLRPEGQRPPLPNPAAEPCNPSLRLSRDRADTRRALALLTAGDHDAAKKLLRSIVLGWPAQAWENPDD